MSRHIKAALPILTITLTLATGCSDYGEVLDPYADMDQGTDMSKVLIPDMPDDTRVDEAPDTTDMEQPDMPVIDALPVPKELQAVAEPTGITLTWLPARGAIRYEVRINGGPWKSTGSEMQFIHEDAPGGSVTSATITASDMTERPHVALEATDIVGAPGPEQTYEVRAVHEDGASMPSAPATASRPFEIATITWERQNEDSPDWLAIPDATSNSALDLTAAPEGDTHTYRALITPTAGQTYTSNTDIGARLAAVKVATGSLHACTLLNSGEVRCWGDNTYGQLGTANTTQLSPDPSLYKIKPVLLPEKVTEISAGVLFTCGLGESKTVYCWGSLITTGTPFPYDTSTSPPTLEPLVGSPINGVKHIPSGHSNHFCYVTQAGNVRCLGDNFKGQCGVESEAPYYIGDIEVDLGNHQVKQLALSVNNSCGLTSNDNILCWGEGYWADNTLSTIGKSPGSMPPPLINTTSSSTIKGLFAGGLGITCVLESLGGASSCWGGGENFVFGNGTNAPIGPLGRYITIYSQRGITPRLIEIGGKNACILTERSEVYCWGMGSTGINGSGDTLGDDAEQRLDTPLSLGGEVTHLSLAPDQCACASVKGDVRCWGKNHRGQLGIPDLPLTEFVGDEEDEMPPQPVQLW